MAGASSLDRGSGSSASRRVLLVYANGEREPWPILPIGLGFVAAALERRGHAVHLVDLMFERSWNERIREAMTRYEPEVVGVGIRNIDNTDWSATRTYLEGTRDRVVAPLRAAGARRVVVGGAAVNIAPGAVAGFVGADAAGYGDGEETMCRLVEAWPEAHRVPDLPGVVHPGTVTAGDGDPCRIEPLAAVAQPRLYRWVDVDRYARAGAPYPVQTKRGCAFDCSFCVYGQIEGRRYRLHDPEAIADEIEQAHGAGIRSFEFTDSLFNVPVHHALAVCRAITDRGLRIGLNTSGVHPAHFTDELMDAMQRAGFEEFSFAPDSASPAVLARLGKGYASPDVLVEAARRAARSRMKVVWWFTVGLPGESRRTIGETVDFVRRHVRPNDLALCTVGVRIYPGTRLERIAIEEGSLDRGYDPLVPVFYRPEAIALEEIRDTLQAASQRLPNLITNSDTRSYPWLLRAGTVVKRLSGHRQPLWAPIPKFNRLRAMPRRIAQTLGLA